VTRKIVVPSGTEGAAGSIKVQNEIRINETHTASHKKDLQNPRNGFEQGLPFRNSIDVLPTQHLLQRQRKL
jgi:hypothetical protein